MKGKLVSLAVCVAAAVLGGCVQAPPPPSFSVASPEEGAAFAPGATIPLELNFENFTLEAPADSTAKVRGRLHESEDPAHQGEHEVMAHEGHYHIYLDNARGADEHVIGWTNSVEFTLPESLTPGAHSLYIELRDSDHTPIGVNVVWPFQCVEP